MNDQEAESRIRHLHGDADVFGDPDGARADLSDFIDVGELRRSTFYKPAKSRVRVVIGRKGSGKTLYLRNLASGINSNESVNLLGPGSGVRPVVAESEQTQLLSTQHVIDVAHRHPGAQLTEVWQFYWGRAIILAAASHLVFYRGLRDHVSEEQRSALLADFKRLLANTREARSPFSAIKQLIHEESRKKAWLDVSDPLWDDLETRVGSLLQHCPPLYFVIDALDEEFSRAPAYWMRCQKGLFYETMRLLRNSRLGGRLHVMISVRDIVFTSIFRSEHASRYIGDPHVSFLDWGYNSAKAFLDAKIQRVGGEFAVAGSEPRDLKEWTGIGRVKNSLGDWEDIYAYALRHTQLLPRDVVIFGNILGAALRARSSDGEFLTEDDFKVVVSRVAQISGNQQVNVAAAQLVADELPKEASQYDFADSYLSVREYRADRADQVVELIRACEQLRIDRATLLELQALGRENLQAPDIGTVLWQAGLLGIQPQNSPAEFFSYDKMGKVRLPMTEKMYVFHPSMREVAGLAPGGGAVEWH